MLRAGNLGSKRVILDAIKNAGGSDCLSASDLLASIYSFDRPLFVQTLRGAIDPGDLLRFVQNSKEKKKPTAVTYVFRLARALTPAEMPVTVAHLLAAVLLEGNNEVAGYLRS